MKKVFTTVIVFAAIVGFTSCKESVKDYAKKYCECVEKHEGQDDECYKILEEAQEKFPDGEKDFKEVAGDCLNK
jgi:hypothetical protein